MKRRRKKARGTRFAKATKALNKIQDRLAGGKITSANVLQVLGHPETKRALAKQKRALHLLTW